MQTTVAPNNLDHQNNDRCPAEERRRGARAVSSRARHRPEGHCNRLAMAFAALDAFPALAEARDRLLLAAASNRLATSDACAAIESDIALTIGVLRRANAAQPGRGRVATVRSALELLDAQAVHALASRVPTFDFFERVSIWESAPERFRLHALATRRAADRIAAELHYQHRDRLAVTSLLHDVGKLVLIRSYPGYPGQIQHGARTPCQRARYERRELGIDHTLIGGVLLQRWGLPACLATAVERHHNPDAEGEAAIIRLDD